MENKDHYSELEKHELENKFVLVGKPIEPIIHFTPVPISMKFFDSTAHNEMGNLYEEDNQLKFKGDVDESAKIFFDYVCNMFKQRIDYLIKNAHK